MDEELAKLTIRVEDRYLKRMLAVADDLRRCGMAIERCDDATGTITGRIQPEKIRMVLGIAGISSLERSENK